MTTSTANPIVLLLFMAVAALLMLKSGITALTDRQLVIPRRFMEPYVVRGNAARAHGVLLLAFAFFMLAGAAAEAAQLLLP